MSAPTPDPTDLCTCGHEERDHVAQGFYKPCLVTDTSEVSRVCFCDDYDPHEETETFRWTGL